MFVVLYRKKTMRTRMRMKKKKTEKVKVSEYKSSSLRGVGEKAEREKVLGKCI